MPPYYIADFDPSCDDGRDIELLLQSVFVGDGYLDAATASQAFIMSHLANRGQLLLAKSAEGQLLGVALVCPPSNPARQIAVGGEVEIQLLAVAREARGIGIASDLIAACERLALTGHYAALVLSTQPSMKAAHRVYERLGYDRNPARDWSGVTGKRYLVYEKQLS